MTGPGGYRRDGRFAGYAPSDASVPVVDAPQPGAAAGGRTGSCACTTPAAGPSGLVGTGEPESVTLPVTYVGGKASPGVDPAITFLSGKQRSIVQQAGTILDRAAAFTGAIPGWLMWPLALLFLLGLPLGAASVLLLSARRS